LELRQSPADLTTIALVTSLQFVVSYSSRIAGLAISIVAGPYAIYALGPTDYGVQGLLLAVLLVLVPRPGTAALQLATLWGLNVIFTGSFNLPALIYIVVSIATHETLLAIFGITTTQEIARPRMSASWLLAFWLGATIGLCKGLMLGTQFLLARWLYKFDFPDSFISEAATVALVFATVGAIFGTRLGYRMRRIAP
jgi:hypothetical protein